MRPLLAFARVFWRGLTRPSRLDRDMDDEMRFHIEMETERYIRERGLDPIEARRQAAVAFGGVEKYRGAGREALGLTWLHGLATDVKLGTRMLRKYPGLTIVAVLALSLAIGAGAVYLEFINDLYRPTLPFAEGDRLVGIQNWDAQSGTLDERSAADFVAWRRSLKSFEDLGAYAALDRNLITDDGRSETVKGVEISASTFRMLRVPPLMGRPLIDSDEQENAASVVVIGYDLWQSRFAGAASIVGRTIKLGAATHTVVGVMPAGFAFPISHDLWAPLRLNDAARPRRDGPAIKIFGRLASNIQQREAQAELTAVGLRTAADSPSTHEHLRPRVKPYVESLWSAQQDGEAARLVLYSANIFFIGLLCVCGANIATLVFARTATRATELTVRTALGASRKRIAFQLFAEALVLCSVAAAVGLAVASFGLQWVKQAVFVAQGLRPMFWWNDQLSAETMMYAAVLAVTAAVIVGVVPAWKATGTQVQDGLKRASAVTSGLKFGGIWTGVIVAQVGLTVIFLCLVGGLGWGVYVRHGGGRELAFAGEQFISARLGMDDDEVFQNSFGNRFRTSYEELERRLAAEPGVAGVTYAADLPGMNGRELQIEVDGMGRQAGRDEGPRIRSTSIDVNLPGVLGVPMVAGRAFTLSDTEENRHVAIVDQTFVRHVLSGRDPIGTRVRKAARGESPAGDWYQIVGVIGDLAGEANKSAADAFLYFPGLVGDMHSTYLAVRVNGDTTAVLSRLRSVAAGVDPTLRVDRIQTLDRLADVDRIAIELFLRVLAGIAAVALLLSTAGVYALMSFTVARRTPEIAIRLALGANPARVVLSTFSRALVQVTLGVLVGCVVGGAIVSVVEPEVVAGSPLWMAINTCAGVAAFMAAVTALACMAPARRALRIQPTDALKAN